MNHIHSFLNRKCPRNIDHASIYIKPVAQIHYYEYEHAKAVYKCSTKRYTIHLNELSSLLYTFLGCIVIPLVDFHDSK